MGLINFIKSQFIEVIEWVDSTNDTIVYRFPVQNKEIKMGAKLTVRESQVAVFVSEGQIADVFGPGLHELQTQNMPILTKLKSWKYGFNSPFKAEVYFINTKQFLDQKWGTSNPVMMRDQEFGIIRLRIFGIYSFRVQDPVLFMKEVFATNELYTVDQISGQIKRMIISGISDMIAETKVPAIDLATQYDELSVQAKNIISPRLGNMGISLVSIFIENISLPEEVEKVIDKRTSMGVIGNMDTYAKYQAAEAIRDAAQNEGGFAGAGVGFGAGAAIGNMFANAMNANTNINNNQAGNNAVQQNNSNDKTPSSGADVKFCYNCGAKLPVATAKFCAGCGTKQE